MHQQNDQIRSDNYGRGMIKYAPTEIAISMIPFPFNHSVNVRYLCYDQYFKLRIKHILIIF